MPNLAIIVSTFNPTGTGVECQFFSVTDTGLVASGVFPYDFNANVSQFHATLEAQAKAAQQALNGVTFQASDKIQISCGRST